MYEILNRTLSKWVKDYNKSINANTKLVNEFKKK